VAREPDPKERSVGLFSIISMIVVGFVVGALARWFYPGAINMGFWATVVVGIVGSLVGGVIGGLMWKSPDGRFHPAGWKRPSGERQISPPITPPTRDPTTPTMAVAQKPSAIAPG